MILFQKKLTSINHLTAEVEETFSGNFSALVYDDLGNVWIEKFAATQEKAEALAEKIAAKVIREY